MGDAHTCSVYRLICAPSLSLGRAELTFATFPKGEPLGCSNERHRHMDMQRFVKHAREIIFGTLQNTGHFRGKCMEFLKCCCYIFLCLSLSLSNEQIGKGIIFCMGKLAPSKGEQGWCLLGLVRCPSGFEAGICLDPCEALGVRRGIVLRRPRSLPCLSVSSFLF